MHRPRMTVTGARVRLTEAGWDTDLAYEVIAEPLRPLEDHEVLVRVEACGVCHRDLIDRAGRFPFQTYPITPGHEAAGVVVAVGAAVRAFAPGDRVATMHRDSCGECASCLAGETSLCERSAWVFGILADGGYATHVIAPERALFAVPRALPAAEAAVLHCTFGTAYRDLVTLGGLRAGERVLVTGANGGVGSAAVQIAARLGAEVVAVVRAESHAAALRALGASAVIVAADGRFTEGVGKIDLALDTVGAATFPAALRTLRVGGRIVVVGNILAERVALNLGYIITLGLRIIGGSGATAAEMVRLLAMHSEVPFAVQIDRVLPLSRADAAQRLVRAGGLRGRVVLSCSAEE